MGKFDSLMVDINIERQNLLRLINELNQFESTPSKKFDLEQVRVVGGILHDFYTGLEKIFERIALVVDGGLPEGDDWHVQLLRRMAASFLERRPAVVTLELADILSEYLSFRHLFRNIYGFELKKERLQNLVEKLPATFKKIENQFNQFLDFLSKV